MKKFLQHEPMTTFMETLPGFISLSAGFGIGALIEKSYKPILLIALMASLYILVPVGSVLGMMFEKK